MKPVVFYIDDEPHNLTVFEAALPEDWEIHIFDNPVRAVEALDKHDPWVIVSDQRMPSMTGVEFLEISKKLKPHALRVIVTGYSDEDLVVESVRKAQVFDYIRKPWEPEDLEATLRRAIDLYTANREAIRLNAELKQRELKLHDQTQDLLKMTTELELAHRREADMRKELECWVPPFVLWALNDKTIKFPIRKNIVGIAFDIVNSSKIHDVAVLGKPLRAVIIQMFSEAIIRHGGWRESHSGDSAYGHFGLLEDNTNPCEAALAVAREFRVALRNLAEVNNLEVECGIALHIAKNSLVDVHTVQLTTPRGTVVQKSFDTTSADIDLLHRMEKLVHALPGTNIILTKEFLTQIKKEPPKLLRLGEMRLSGQKNTVELFLIPSDLVAEKDIQQFKGRADTTKDAA